MAIKPEIIKSSLSNINTSDIVNTVRAQGSNTLTGINFQDRLPECNQESLNTIANIFDSDSDLANAFLKEILNRIGLVTMNYQRYENNLKFLKQGRLEYGETVEEIAFGLVKGKCDYEVEEGVTDVFEITLPEVASALHKVNFQQKYPLSITRAELRKAFTSERSLGSFIEGAMTTFYNSYEVDEQLSYKNLIKVALEKGFGVVEFVPNVVDEATGKQFVKRVIALTTKLAFMSSNYSLYGIPQFSHPEDLIIIMDADLNASISVDVLAAAFNMNKVEFMQSGRKVLIDEFPVNGVHGIVANRRFFQIYDNDFSLDSIYNPSNRVWNYFLHVWEIISVSPFMQCIIFAETGSGSVTSITLNPTTSTVNLGNTVKITATVEGTGIVSGKVIWELSGSGEKANGNPYSTINQNGVVYVGKKETAKTLTVTATSYQDNTKTATATITVGNN